MKIVHSFAILLLAFTLVACGDPRPASRASSDRSPAALPRDTAPWAVSLAGYGPVRTGSTRAALLSALGAPPLTGRAGPVEPCEYVDAPDGPLAGAVSFMVVNDTVGRVDVDSLPVATAWGDRVGDSEAAVLARHAGHVRVEPHKYTGPQGHYLVVTSSNDTLHRLIFETDGQRVTRYRAGLRPYVEWIEGCS
jgi:hypothetical protein